MFGPDIIGHGSAGAPIPSAPDSRPAAKVPAESPAPECRTRSVPVVEENTCTRESPDPFRRVPSRERTRRPRQDRAGGAADACGNAPGIRLSPETGCRQKIRCRVE
jgi:hypothetical protein